MPADNEPLVSFVTPVYNGGEYLAECIQSVLNQHYKNWEYIILNNCSTDRTLAIAEKYAAVDERIKIHSNDRLLPIMENWNRSMRLIDPESQYCKVVHADDWLYPQCVKEMVRVAESHPSVGIVGAYGLKGKKLVSDGLPFPEEWFEGKEICRQSLLKQIFPFPRPTALLIRSDLIRKKDPFYNESKLQADHEVCYDILLDHDFGFVHQVLTYMREHEESVTSTNYAVFGKLHYTNLELLINFGPVFLSEKDYQRTLKTRIKQYDEFLALSLIGKKNKNFWEYHKNALQELGHRLSRSRLYLTFVLTLLSNPRMTLSKIKHLVHG